MFPSLDIMYDSNVFVNDVHKVTKALQYSFNIEINNVEEYNHRNTCVVK